MEQNSLIRLQEGKVFWIKTFLIVSLIVNISVSWKLWITTREYPLVSLFDGLFSIPYPFDHGVIGSFILFLLGILFLRSQRIVLVVSLLLAGVLVLTDISRLQPWFYQYISMLVIYCLYCWNYPSFLTLGRVLTSYQFLMACTYIWSGIGKINPYFPQLFPYFLSPLDIIFPHVSTSIPSSLWILLPLGEILIGVLLLTKMFRMGVVMGIAMHLYILFILGPFGHGVNSIVWSWNATMMGLLYILFWHPHVLPLSHFFLRQTRIFSIIILILFGILPFFSLFGKWDGYLSFALYTGNADYGGIYFDKSLYSAMPTSLAQHAEVVENRNYYIGLNAWAYEQLNVPTYPEKRVFIQIAKQLCRDVHNSPKMVLIVTERRIHYGKTPHVTKYRCYEL